MVAVVIPCFRVHDTILNVLQAIGPEIHRIYVVDDACPEKSGDYVKSHVKDPRIEVLFHSKNQGVGGAMVTGYKAAIRDNAEVVIKVDGDGQMDIAKIPLFIRAITTGEADYVKGNRFYSWEMVAKMPKLRLIGNGILSFLCKSVSGYWSIMDPTNGYTAISGQILKLLPLDKIDKGYFFESDMLFRLGTLRALTLDLPLDAIYRGEKSSLSLFSAALDFPPKFIIRTLKRIGYNYFLRDFNIGSIYLLSSIFMISFGTSFGIYKWVHSVIVSTSSGTVMLAALPVILGFQLFVQFVSFDITNEPKIAVHKLLLK